MTSGTDEGPDGGVPDDDARVQVIVIESSLLREGAIERRSFAPLSDRPRRSTGCRPGC
jgi:hypothetical protein